MTTDKLADALENARLHGASVLGEDYDEYPNPNYVADWLRSPAGIQALSEDETIREGVLTAYQAHLEDTGQAWWKQ